MKIRLSTLAVILASTAAVLHAVTFYQWRSSNFTSSEMSASAISGPTADPDGDGVPNLSEYAFFGLPNVSDSTILPALELVDDTLALTYRERHGMTDVAIRLVGSDTLSGWITYNSVLEADRVSQTGYDEVTLLDPSPFTNGRKFLRVRVELLPVDDLRPPVQGNIRIISPANWSLSWNDQNTNEASHAIERQLVTGEWERLATIGPDVSHWSHTTANYQTSMVYRVVAISDDGEAASAPFSPLDTDGDGIPDALELGASYNGQPAHYGSYSNEYSSSGSGLADGLLAANGYDPTQPFAGVMDTDEDGIPDFEELLSGTDPRKSDTDGDGVEDKDDGWPRHKWITSPPLPDVIYTVVPLRPGLPLNASVLEIDNDQNVLVRSAGSLAIWKQGETNTTPVPVRGFYQHLVNRPDNTYSHIGIYGYDILRRWLEDHAEPRRMSRGGYIAGSVLHDDGDAMAAVWKVGTQAPTIYDEITYQQGSATGFGFSTNSSGELVGWRSEFTNAFGNVSHGAYNWSTQAWVATGPLAIDEGVFDFTGHLVIPFEINDHGQILAHIESASAVYSFFNDHYYYPVNENLAIIDDGTAHSLGNDIAIAPLLSSSTPAVATGGRYLGSPWLGYKDQSTWKREEFRAWNGETFDVVPFSYARAVNKRLEFVANDYIVRNGRVFKLDNLVAEEWSSASGIDINDKGIILAVAKKMIDANGDPISNPQREPVLLIPAGFAHPARQATTLHKPHTVFGDASEGPSVKLNAITTGDISISGDTATVTVAGVIEDGPMGTLPAGEEGEITQVKVYIDGSETTITGNVTRQAPSDTFWAPYGSKGTIAPFNVSFPANGTANIEIVTTPNLLGLSGRSGFEVVFNETTGLATPVAGVTYSADIVLSGPLTSSNIDTVLLTTPDAATGETLTETSANSLVFTNSSKTVSFAIYSDVVSGVALADTIEGRLNGVLDVPVYVPAGQDADEGVETATGSGRFRFSVTRSGYNDEPTRSWSLQSVRMSPPIDGANVTRPMTFTAPAVSDASMTFLETEFNVAKITGHPDQSTAYAVTATNKPLLGFVATREVDDEKVREFVYYDHTASVIVRLPLDGSAGMTEWSLSFGDEENPAVATSHMRSKSIRLIDSDGEPALGINPHDIEELITFITGEDENELDPENTFQIELTGYRAGEVVRLFSQEAIDDRFDLVIPGATALLVPDSTKFSLLESTSSGTYKTSEKLVVYSTPGEPSRRLSSSQWANLKSLGYIAIHNEDFVVREPKDIFRWIKEFFPRQNGLHPPANTVLGATLNEGSMDIADYKYKGYSDHHVFNN